MGLISQGQIPQSQQLIAARSTNPEKFVVSVSGGLQFLKVVHSRGYLAL
jgi:hypothetical protein